MGGRCKSAQSAEHLWEGSGRISNCRVWHGGGPIRGGVAEGAGEGYLA